LLTLFNVKQPLIYFDDHCTPGLDISRWLYCAWFEYIQVSNYLLIDPTYHTKSLLDSSIIPLCLAMLWCLQRKQCSRITCTSSDCWSHSKCRSIHK